MMQAIKNLLRRLVPDSRGVAALEFALAMPFLIALFVASTDLMRLMLTHQKAERIAYNTADLVAQVENLTPADVAQIFLAPPEIMEPMEFGPRGRVIISSVHRPVDGEDMIVRWQCEGAGTLEAESLIGIETGTAVLPENLEINFRENVIVAEVYYDFEPWFPVGMTNFMNVGVLYKTAVFKPRFGALPTKPC